ncbi:MAG: hypothetical protein M1308_05810 [Actinobacteria bacterium]|nr:hypothetical protein [Actinomycetota bacterium]
MKKGSLIMHPGPVNRGIEISENVMNHGKNYDGFKINTQITNGVAVRMALIYLMLGST